ncbi:MAG: RIP metalloprotease RseP [Paludibacteraceae bacterium]|nr:RIP metalloprotease RseP [Paludibacteraceae bacterium]
MGTLTVILQLLASLSLLVVIHEFGHFLFAKLFKIRVEKFRMFFDPWVTLFHFKPKNSDTDYGIGWLPLGGYVKIAGMIDESLDTEQMAKPAEPWEFRAHPAWQRLLVMLGGVLFNLLTAFVIYSGLTYSYGDTYLPIDAVEEGMQFSNVAKRAGFQDGDILLKADDKKLVTFDEENVRLILNAENVTVRRNGKEERIVMPGDFMKQMLKEQKGFASYRIPFVVDSVIAGLPAATANMQSGDKVIAINGQLMDRNDVYVTLHNNPGKDLNLTIVRAGDTLTQKMVPTEKGMIGVLVRGVADMYPLTTVSYSLFESVPVGVGRAIKKLTNYAGDLKFVFTPEGISSVGGFGTIAKLYPETFNFEVFWTMTAFLSVILAVGNVLPIPGLDGGHILFVLYEMVTRRKPSQKFLLRAQVAGMMFLFFLMLFANLNDVFRHFFK